jgi:hypothetical protein
MKGPPPQLHNLGSGGSGENPMGPSGQGYISDYYLKQSKAPKRAFDGGTGSGNDDHSDDGFNAIMHGQGAPGYQDPNNFPSSKVSNKKFFKSKIDFTAPIRGMKE